METTQYHPFKSSYARDRYLKSYHHTEEFWPVPSESRMVETSFGQTLVRINGPEGAAPVVLLHGICCTSLMWIPQIGALSQYFRTFAIDDIYDYGGSIYTKTIYGSSDYVNWLDELFSALQLNHINLIGMSYGGWQACQYALSFADRLDKIVLIAPAATILLPNFCARLGFTMFTLPSMRIFFSAVMPEHFFRVQMRCMVKYYIKEDKKAMESFIDSYATAAKCFKPKTVPNPTVLQDSELSSIKIPALFIVGENERIYPAQKALRHLERIAPEIKGVLINGAGHDLLWKQTELVNQKILEFLQEKIN